jgi:hypothetical protein
MVKLHLLLDADLIINLTVTTCLTESTGLLNVIKNTRSNAPNIDLATTKEVKQEVEGKLSLGKNWHLQTFLSRHKPKLKSISRDIFQSVRLIDVSQNNLTQMLHGTTLSNNGERSLVSALFETATYRNTLNQTSSRSVIVTNNQTDVTKIIEKEVKALSRYPTAEFESSRNLSSIPSFYFTIYSNSKAAIKPSKADLLFFLFVSNLDTQTINPEVKKTFSDIIRAR